MRMMILSYKIILRNIPLSLLNVTGMEKVWPSLLAIFISDTKMAVILFVLKKKMHAVFFILNEVVFFNHVISCIFHASFSSTVRSVTACSV